MTLMCLKHLKNNKLYRHYTISAIVRILYPAPESTGGEVNKLKSVKKTKTKGIIKGGEEVGRTPFLLKDSRG